MAFEEVGVRAIVQDFGRYMAQLGQMEQKTQSFGTKLGAAVKKGAVIAGAAIAAVGAISIKTFGDFDAAMTSSLAIMGDVSDEMRGDMSKAARQVAKVTTFSAKQAAEAYFFLASAGLDAASSVKALPRVAKFAQAGMFDMAKATDLATDAQSALGLTIRDDAVKNLENLTKVTDILVKANTLANATVEQFSESLTTEAGAALKAFNIDVEEGVAVLAAFADQGIKGQVAGTGLSRILRLMTSAAVENSGAYAELSVRVFDAQGNINNLADIIGDLEIALGDMSDAERVAALESLGFQARVQGIILPLLGSADAIRDYDTELRKAAGITDEIAEKQLKTFNAQVTLLWHKIQDAFIVIGSKLVPVLLELMTVLENQVVPAVKSVVLVAADMFGWMTRNKEVVGILAGVVVALMVPAILAWTAAAWANVAAQAAMAAAMLLANPPLLALVGAVGLLGAAYLLTDKQGQNMALGLLQSIGLVEAKVFAAVLGPFGIDPLFGKVVDRMDEAGEATDELAERQRLAAGASEDWAKQTIADMQAMVGEGQELGLTIEQIELAQLEKLAQELADVGRLMSDQDIGPIWSATMEEVIRSSGLSADEIDKLVDRAVELTGATTEGAGVIREQLTTALEGMDLPAKRARDDLLELTDAAGEIPGPVDEAAEAFTTFQEDIDAAMEGVGESIKSVLPTIDEEFAAWDERLAEMAAAYTDFQTNLETILAALVASHVEQPELIIQALADAGPGVTQAMATHLAENPVAAVDTTLANLGVVVGTNIQGATDAVLQKTPAFEAQMAGLAAGAVEAVETEMAGLSPVVDVQLNATAQAIRNKTDAVATAMRILGKDAIGGFVQGFHLRSGETLSDFIGRQFRLAQEASRAVLDANSPSMIFADIGRDIIAGLELGLSGGRPQQSAISEMALPHVAPAEVVRDTVLAPSAPATIPGLDQLAQALGETGGMSVSVSAASQEQVAAEVAAALRGLAHDMGRN